ncbi:LysR family transcriptional regulator [Nitratireductor thuwali]|uniref:HTH-type transcriptional activator AllS n=1 Tax=Nitratireductor thuwali TaxID=2267699 RepID=A0ABY5MR48_9HYPH|nr:HTH-type transcriptional activator AllS [Nitratireductor thuwali]
MIDALTLDQLRAFVSVVEAGSFRGSAKRLSRVQSAVSYSVGNLETQLGVTLFDRSGHRPKLTPQGLSLLAHARSILLKVDAMRARARELGEGVELELSIVIDSLYPMPWIMEALHAIRRSYVGVSIRLEVLPLGGPPAAIQEGRVTLGILAGEDLTDSRIELEAMHSHSFVAVAARTHPLAAAAEDLDTLEAVVLAEHVQIVLSDPTQITEGRDFGVLSPTTWRVNNQETKYAMIRAGHGWGRLPHWVVDKNLASGELVRLPVVALGLGGQTDVQFYLARRIDRPLGPVARAFREAILANHASGT